MFRDSTVVVQTPEPMDAEVAQRSIGVERADNVVKVDRERKRATWSPPDDLPAGRHVLQIGPLLSSSDGELSPEVGIPFHLVDSDARIPRDVAIESMIQLKLTANGPQRLPLCEPVRGKYIEMMKGVNRRTRAPVELAFDETGKRVDETRLLKQLEQKRAAKLGKLHEDLYQRFVPRGRTS